MPRRKSGLEITQNSLRTTFAILRNQLRLADENLRLRAIYEFRRELECHWMETIDHRAQANGTSHEEELTIVTEEAKTWIAQQPEST